MSRHNAVLVLITLILTACGPSAQMPTAPMMELVDVTRRIDAGLVNAHTYGTFAIAVPGGLTAIRSGPANFPGNPPGGPGTCIDGRWINSKGKPTAGSLTHPHPHCVRAGTAMTIVLEPISSRVRDPNQACSGTGVCDFLYFSDPKDGNLDVQAFPGIKGGAGRTEGDGIVEAYAIDAATLGTTNVRVGVITIDLNQFDDPASNMFGTCDLDDTNTFACLPMVASATYQPLAIGGAGSLTTATGFLWWAPAGSPYNY